ncbi:hypothetical protein [Pseudacidovorax sp. RU35E]|uniref:hypothetical protein n=1 Tax=Pseudacidovorax sp. RU35E TaxID=1907403 RepID=UPI000955217A|nr:hypothetical protein [Pseudacidovorax sp. RU35E]SIQ88190.1 hypothetical protein SAMN05880557_106162 [Pseudacidovorax sp. RU35E]
MSLEYLARIQNERFPLAVRQTAEVDHVLLLKAAQLITASVPAAGPFGPGSAREAVVFGITELGLRSLRQATLPPEQPLHRQERLSDFDA